MAPSSERLLAVTCSGLSVTREEAAQVLQALHHLTRLVVFRGLSSAEAVLALFPENFHQNLKNLLTKIILEHISTWRTDAQASQISLPRLVDLDWRVDIKASSDSVGRMAVPTCLLQVKVKMTIYHERQETSHPSGLGLCVCIPESHQDPRRPQAMRGQTLRLGCHHGAEQRNAGHHARRLGPHPRPAFCRGQ
ncbi:COMM domain-containing protein 9 isoform X3 [Tupaia chinensis]|nr:COMM domain-containing protein 9 isoform X3 [Tupaia chinensis]